MLYKLQGSNDELTVSPTMWDQLLNLARNHGWKPAGTHSPVPTRPGASWSGTYTSNEGQAVDAEDAANLADALQRAIGDEEPPSDAEAKTDAAPMVTTPLGTPVNTEEWFRTDARGVVLALITLFRAGGFQIG